MSLWSMKAQLRQLNLRLDGGLANGSGCCPLCWAGVIARTRDDGVHETAEPSPPEPCPACGRVPEQVLVHELLVYSRQHYRELCQEGGV